MKITAVSINGLNTLKKQQNPVRMLSEPCKAHLTGPGTPGAEPTLGSWRPMFNSHHPVSDITRSDPRSGVPEKCQLDSNPLPTKCFYTMFRSEDIKGGRGHALDTFTKM